MGPWMSLHTMRFSFRETHALLNLGFAELHSASDHLGSSFASFAARYPLRTPGLPRTGCHRRPSNFCKHCNGSLQRCGVAWHCTAVETRTAEIAYVVSFLCVRLAWQNVALVCAMSFLAAQFLDDAAVVEN